MSVKIRLARRGKRHEPFYHIVVTDERNPRDSSFIEVLGTYDPKNREKRVTGKKDRIEYWMGKGAVPTETVSQLLRTLQ
ncbi:MAG: 30S ribosomal protein S16 [Proteobacteria bacterium]|nr:30S ribosomal protein S16 [Pseudomonadota bacterium]